MAKSRKQRQIEARDRKASKTILTVIVVSLVLILTLMYFVFANA